jgi:hypothetical protein
VPTFLEAGSTPDVMCGGAGNSNGIGLPLISDTLNRGTNGASAGIFCSKNPHGAGD